VLDEMSAAGVKEQAADPVYYYTQGRAIIVDDATVFIMTCNLTLSGLGGSSYTANREYGIVDTNGADVLSQILHACRIARVDSVADDVAARAGRRKRRTLHPNRHHRYRSGVGAGALGAQRLTAFFLTF